MLFKFFIFSFQISLLLRARVGALGLLASAPAPSV